MVHALGKEGDALRVASAVNSICNDEHSKVLRGLEARSVDSVSGVLICYTRGPVGMLTTGGFVCISVLCSALEHVLPASSADTLPGPAVSQQTC